jgi:hypothetical protein
MAIGETVKGIWRGETLSTSLGYLFVSQEEIDRGRLADSQLEAINREAFEGGRISGDAYAQTIANIKTGATDQLFRNKETNPFEGFKEGAAEGLESMQSAVKGGLSGILGGVLGFIPWWAWVGAAGFVAWKIGLLDALGKKAVKKWAA